MNTLDPPRAPGRAASLSQRVVDGVSERIRRGQLKPGERVPTEPELMREFGVSRSVVREAVSWLQAGGLVRTRQGVGSFVLAAQPALRAQALLPAAQAALEVQQKLAMLELRMSLESEAAALAAQRRRPEQLAAMERALDDFDRAHRAGEATPEADFRFHEAVAEATGNAYFVQVLRSLSAATIARPAQRPARAGSSSRARRFGEASPQLLAGKDITAQEHRAVLDAIRRGDPSMARAAMYMHLNNSRERLKAGSARSGRAP